MWTDRYNSEKEIKLYGYILQYNFYKQVQRQNSDNKESEDLE